MRHRANSALRRTQRVGLLARRPRLELLEERQLLSTFTVKNASDAGADSLRDAITKANANVNSGGPDLINFLITGGGIHTISLVTPLPTLDDPVSILGYALNSGQTNTSPDSTNAKLTIQILGSNLSAAQGFGLVINTQGVVIDGLELSGFKGAAIADTKLGGNAQITGNFLGPDATGTNQIAAGNNVAITLQTGGNTIGGGNVLGTRNLISGNVTGVLLTNPIGLSSNNLVAGNLIGSAATGLTPIQNTDGIILNAGTTGNTIGGLTAAARNLISANVTGVRILGDATIGNLVVGNFIGVDATGNAPMANLTGVLVSAPGNAIGGGSLASRNVISGNSTAGLLIDTSASANPSANVVVGNYIGLNVTGTAAIPNAVGVAINGASAATIGGAATTLGNVISGNSGAGISIGGASASADVVLGNFIGTNPAGSAALPNGGSGVLIAGGTGHVVGGTLAAARNVISGNGGFGVEFNTAAATPTHVAVQGNFIGTDASGTASLGNTMGGVLAMGTGQTIGGVTAGAGNLISGNAASGVLVGGAGSAGLVVAGNLIGVDNSGVTALPNGMFGIDVQAGTGLTIGGTAVTARNVVSGNSIQGVVLNAGSSGTTLLGNFIGTDRTGLIAVGNGSVVGPNFNNGVLISGSTGNTIGGLTAGSANVVSGNARDGIQILGSASGNVVEGNRIGTNAPATVALANGSNGVNVQSSFNVVGGTVFGAGNVISGNANLGVSVGGLGTTTVTNVLIAGNFVGTDLNGTAAIPNFSGIGFSGATASTIGGTVATARNVVSGNTSVSILLGAGSVNSSGNLVAGNYVGVDKSGLVALANGEGVDLQAPGNTIGGSQASYRNVLSGNKFDGVVIETTGASSVVLGNYIGVGSDGLTKIGNGDNGILIRGPGATIGGLTAGSGNVIANSQFDGIQIKSTGPNAFIGANIIGLGANGTTKLGNGGSGVNVAGASGVTIGGGTTPSANVISANLQDGVEIFSVATGGLVQGNFIGTDASGTIAAGNGIWGISIDSASNVTIGGTAATGNVIAFNGDPVAIGIFGGVGISAGTNNPIIGNHIFGNVGLSGLGIDLGKDGVTLNHVNPSTGPNNFQNFPILGSALAGPTSTTIAGTLVSTPNAKFTIQFFVSDTADPSGYGEGQVYLGQSQSIMTDGTGTANFTTIVPVHANAGQFLSAVATDSTGNSSEFALNIVVANSATDLALTITAAPEPVQVGQNLVYTITVTNNGPNPASGVTVTDSLPGTVTYVSSSTPAPGTTSFSAGVVTGSVGILAAGASTTVTITVTPNSPTSPGVPLQNTASVSSTEGDTNLSNNIATANSTVIASADLAVTITTSPPTPPGTILLGQILTYTITVSNTGPSPAANVVLTDNLPASFTFVSATSTQVVIVQNGQLVTGTIASLAANATATITLMVKPSTTGIFTNSVTFSSTTADPSPADGGPVSVTTTVLPSSDLGVTIAANPTPGLVGQPYTYTVTVVNNGQGDATNVTVIDTLPSSVIFQSSSSIPAATLSRNGQMVKAVFATLSSGLSATFTIVVTPTVSGMITDGAVVSADQGDPFLPNNTATLTTTIAPTTDLGVTVTASPNPVAVGGLLQYVVTVSNSGPNSASNVVATDTLPANVMVVSVTPSQGTFSVNGSIVSLKFGSIAANGSPVTATITVKPLAASAGMITDTVSVGGNEADPVLGNNTASVTTTVNASADLVLTLTGTPNPVLVGTNLTYTILITNNGPSTATGVSVQDFLPANVNVLSVTTDGKFSQGTNLVIANPMPIASGGTSTVTIVVQTTTLTMSNILNTASVSSAVADPVSTNNSATISTQVTPSADLALTVTGNPDPLLIGGNLTYTFNVINNGPSNATNVTLTDNLPLGAVYVDSPPVSGISVGLSSDGTTFSATLGSLAVGTSKLFTLIVQPTTTGQIQNTATVTAVQADPALGNNTVNTFTTITPSADISVTASSQPPTILLGQAVTFSFNVVNQGPSDSAGVVLTAVIPSGVSIGTVLTNLGTITTAGQTVILSLPTLASGSLATLSVTGATTAVGSLVATGSVTSIVQDPSSANNSTFAAANVIAAADLAIAEMASANPAPLHGNLTYSILVTNNGPSDAHNVVLTDVLPAGALFVSATTSGGGGSFTPVAGVLTVPLGTLLNGQSTLLTLVVSPTLMGTLNNTVSVGGSEADTVASNSTNVQLVTVSGFPGNAAFSAAGYVVDEKAGVATITVNRINGTDGPASVDVATGGGSAVPGVNYIATKASVFFADGQNAATFTVPILDDGRNNGDTVVGLVLSNPTGGLALASPSSALLTIREADSNGNTIPTVAPLQVIRLKRFGIHKQATQLVVAFNGQVSASSAQNPANYVVVFPDTGEVIPVSSASYNANTSSVTLLMSRQLDVHKTYQITIRGTGTGAISTPNGSLLDGNGDNTPGGDYVAPINAGTLTFPAPTFKSKPTVAHKSSSHSHVHLKTVTGWANHLKARMGGR